MRCPIDGVELVMTDRQGVEIDYCPTCRGVWLDRGELDKIIERSNQVAGAQAALGAATGEYRPDHHDPRYQPPFGDSSARPYGQRPYDADRGPAGYDPRGGYGGIDPRTGRPHKRKKKGFLEELFDFD